MRIQDKSVIARLVFCALFSAAVGCGDSGGTSQGDSGTAGDANPADHPLAQDGATKDGAITDALITDALIADGAIVDGAIFEAGELRDGSLADGGVTDADPVSGDAFGDAAVLTQARITFVLKNTGATAVYVYLRDHCGIDFQVASLADGTVYEDKLICMCRCADTTCQGEIACAPCAQPSGIAVAPGGSRELPWVAQTNSIERKTGTFGEYSCLSHAPIATGPYRISVPTFDSSSDAAAGTNAKTVTADFELVTSNANVEVKLR